MYDEKYMERAIALAWGGIGKTSPNPLVGAVIVKDKKIIGEGFHMQYGAPHAERNALADCKDKGYDPRGACLYVTLTPCCHYGKTPPCTEAIIESGISEVMIGSRDPNPLVMDKSITILRDAGIKVTCDVLKNRCDELNPAFFHFITHRTPYVIMKYAMTLDGKIATATGHSRWITGEQARQQVHKDRNRYTAIMTGIGTVLSDDPLLTCRIPDGRNPIRIICDTHLQTPLASKLAATASQVRTIIATATTNQTRLAPYIEAGFEPVIVNKDKLGHIHLKDLMRKLGAMNIDSILLEGGATLNWSALRSGIVSRVQTYIAPKLFGGEDAKSPVGGQGVERPDQAVMLKPLSVTRLGEDLLIESEVIPCLQES